VKAKGSRGWTSSCCGFGEPRLGDIGVERKDGAASIADLETSNDGKLEKLRSSKRTLVHEYDFDDSSKDSQSPAGRLGAAVPPSSKSLRFVNDPAS
jgi:hypothetical protein